MNNLTKHTPGPWTINESPNELLIYSKTYGAVTTILVKHTNPHIGEHQANAELISRAPELLEENESLKKQTEKLIGTVTLANEKIQNLKAKNKELIEALEFIDKDMLPTFLSESAQLKLDNAIKLAKS